MCNKMSDVRLSNASPTLERGVDARPADALRPPVRRNLFGSRSPDRAEEIRRYLNASIQDDVRDFMEHYNFDPVNDRPLSPRNYEWEEDQDAAEFYRRPPHRRLETRARGEAAAPAPDAGPEEENNSSSLKRRRRDQPGNSPLFLPRFLIFITFFGGVCVWNLLARLRTQRTPEKQPLCTGNPRSDRLITTIKSAPGQQKSVYCTSNRAQASQFSPPQFKGNF